MHNEECIITLRFICIILGEVQNSNAVIIYELYIKNYELKK